MTDPQYQKTVENPWLRMALNNAWANSTFYEALMMLDEKAFAAPRPGFFPSLKRTMNHIYEVDLYSVDALEGGGKGRSVFEREDVGSPAMLGGLQADVDMRFAMFCGALDEDALLETRKTERQGMTAEENVAALILHLLQHQIHHRGQAHVQLADAGVPPPQLDDFYLEFGRVPSAEAYW